MDNIRVSFENIEPIPQKAYLAAAGSPIYRRDNEDWRNFLKPSVDNGPLLYFQDGNFDLKAETSLPTGFRASLQSLLVVLAGNSEITTTIVREQAHELAIAMGVVNGDSQYLEGRQFDNTVRAAFKNPSALFSFDEKTGTNISSRDSEVIGSQFVVDGSDRYNQLATAIAFSNFIENSPVPLFEITELATGNGEQLTSLLQIIETVYSADLGVGEYIRIHEPDDTKTRPWEVPTAITNVLEKLKSQGVLDYQIELISKIQPTVVSQLNKVIENEEDLYNGNAIFYGFDAEYVENIIDAYNQVWGSGAEISTNTVFEKLQELPIETNGKQIDKHDVSVFLSRLNSKLKKDGIEYYPRVIPAGNDKVLLKKGELKFSGEDKNISADLQLLLSLAETSEQGFVYHNDVKAHAKNLTNNLTGGDRALTVFANKYLDFQSETRAIMVGLKNDEQYKSFIDLKVAIEVFYNYYDYLIQAEEGRSQLTQLFDRNLVSRNEAGDIGYLKERESIAKVLLKYCLQLAQKNTK